MWKPKKEDNDIYIGKLARIYCTDGAYREGKLVYIKKSENITNSYSICVENIIGYPTRNTVTSNLIERLDVKMFEILEETKNICNKYLNNDMYKEITNYVNPFISI